MSETSPGQSTSDTQAFPDRVLALILAGRWWILFGILILTIWTATIVYSTEFTTSLAKSFVDRQEEYDNSVGLENWFEGNPDSLIYVAAKEGPQLWTGEKLIAIRMAAQDLNALPGVANALTLADIPASGEAESGIGAAARRSALSAKLKQGELPETLPPADPLLPIRIAEMELGPEDLDRLTDWVLGRKEHAERMISQDQQSHLMLVEVEEIHELSPTEQAALLNDVKAVLAEHGLGEQGLYFSGLLVLQVGSIDQIDVTLYKLLPLGIFGVAAMVFFLFRRLEPIAIVGVVAFVSVMWGIGFGDWLYGSFSILTMAVPLMVIVISTGDVIHLISAYCADLEKGNSHELALRKTFREMSSACTLTSLTTFVGFSSLGLVPSQTVRQFGLSAAVGIASALVLSVVLVPIFIDWLHTKGWTMRLEGRHARGTQKVAEAFANIGTRFPIPIIAIFSVFLTSAVYLTLQVRLDPDIYRRFRSSHPLAVSTEFFIEQFGGVSSIELVLSGEKEVLWAPETLGTILELSNWYEENLEVEEVASIASALSKVLTELGQGSVETAQPDKVHAIPESVDHALGLLLLLERNDGRLSSSLVTEDRRALRLVAHVPATSYLELRRLTSAIVERAQSHLPDSIQIREKGSAPLIGNAVGEIIRGHMYGFVVSFLMIVFLIAFGLRSLRLGLIAVPTNLIPLLSLGGMLALTSAKADSDVLGVATLGLGLAVDDTIHFLSRYRRELRAEGDADLALRGSVQHTGVAIVRTTTILAVGFLPFCASDYWSINMLGTYLVLILVFALVADLLLLPALVKVFGPKGK